MKSLIAKASKCDLCKADLPQGPRPVFQVDPEAVILVAGQAPGRKVHESGIPFDDASGERLREWLGVDTATFYDAKKMAILPMGFCYPGTGKSGDLPPRPECAEKWRKPMLDGLVNIKLTLVIGQYAMAYHMPETKKQRLTDVVRQWRDHWPTLLPLPHPSPRNNIWLKKNPWFVEEVVPSLQKRVKALLRER